MMTTEFKMPEPVAIVESWTNGSYGRNYKLAWQDNADTGDALYKSSDMRAVIASREPLYRAINAMMAQLGAHGEINTRNPLVTAVMDALHDVDGGAYQPAKDIDMEALKRGQENAVTAWAGVDVEKFLQREPQPMPLGKAEELAHRTASRYTHKSDRSFTAYTFLPHTLEDFVRKIEKHHGIG